MKNLIIFLFVLIPFIGFTQQKQQRVDASDVIVRNSLYLVELDSTISAGKKVMVWDPVTKLVFFGNVEGTGGSGDSSYLASWWPQITPSDTARWGAGGLWQSDQSTYTTDNVSIGKDTLIPAYLFYVEGDAKFGGSIQLESSFPSIEFKNENGAFVDAELILLNDSTMVLNNVQFFGWNTQPISESGVIKMVVMDTVTQKAYHMDIPTGGQFDTTHIYSALNDTAAAIRADIPTSFTFDTTHIYNALVDTAAAIRADFPTTFDFDTTHIYSAIDDTAAAIRADIINFDTTHIYGALDDTASAIRADFIYPDGMNITGTTTKTVTIEMVGADDITTTFNDLSGAGGDGNDFATSGTAGTDDITIDVTNQPDVVIDLGPVVDPIYDSVSAHRVELDSLNANQYYPWRLGYNFADVTDPDFGDDVNDSWNIAVADNSFDNPADFPIKLLESAPGSGYDHNLQITFNWPVVFDSIASKDIYVDTIINNGDEMYIFRNNAPDFDINYNDINISAFNNDANFIKRPELADTAAAIRADIVGGSSNIYGNGLYLSGDTVHIGDTLSGSISLISPSDASVLNGHDYGVEIQARYLELSERNGRGTILFPKSTGSQTTIPFIHANFGTIIGFGVADSFNYDKGDELINMEDQLGFYIDSTNQVVLPAYAGNDGDYLTLAANGKITHTSSGGGGGSFDSTYIYRALDVASDSIRAELADTSALLRSLIAGGPTALWESTGGKIQPISTTDIINARNVDGYQISDFNAISFNSNSTSTKVGRLAGSSNTTNSNVFLGYSAGGNSTASNSVLVGALAGSGNTGSSATIIGQNAGTNNTGSSASVIGRSSAQNNSGVFLSAIGHTSAFNNKGDNVTALGMSSAYYNEGDNVISVGAYSGRSSTTTTDSNIYDHVAMFGYLSKASMSNQIVFSDEYDQLKANNYKLNIDQPITAGMDGYALVLNYGTGEIELDTISGGGGGGGGTDDQILESAVLTGTDLLIEIEDGGDVTADLSGIVFDSTTVYNNLGLLADSLRSELADTAAVLRSLSGGGGSSDGYLSAVALDYANKELDYTLTGASDFSSSIAGLIDSAAHYTTNMSCKVAATVGTQDLNGSTAWNKLTDWTAVAVWTDPLFSYAVQDEIKVLRDGRYKLETHLFFNTPSNTSWTNIEVVYRINGTETGVIANGSTQPTVGIDNTSIDLIDEFELNEDDIITVYFRRASNTTVPGYLVDGKSYFKATCTRLD